MKNVMISGRREGHGDCSPVPAVPYASMFIRLIASILFWVCVWCSLYAVNMPPVYIYSIYIYIYIYYINIYIHYISYDIIYIISTRIYKRHACPGSYNKE